MIAKGFLDAGCERVYITGRDADVCASAAAELGERCVSFPHDVSTTDGCNRLASEYGAREDRLDILVNNAGLSAEREFDAFAERDWDDVMTVNLRAPFFLTRALHGKLAAAGKPDRPSKVINIASIDAIRLNPAPAYSYTASKAGLVLLTRRMAADLIHDHIAVTAISPGSFATAINVRALEHGDELAANNPSGRIGRDEDMQGVAIYLASRAGDWVVGENIVVDGGLALAKLGT